MKTAISAEEKETGLIVDKLYQALYNILQWSGPRSDGDIQYAIEVLEEFETKYSTAAKSSED